MCKSVYVPVLIEESSFHTCGGHVKLVQACLCGENTLQRRFNRRGSAVMHVQACFEFKKRPRKQFSPLWRYCKAGASMLMGSKHPKTHLNHRGGAVNLVQACFKS